MARKSSSRTSGCGCGQPACPDSRCEGLRAFERPRFFAGQLLTEQELNAEQDYLRAKNRLHNLHLHGWGVVCGLEVTCHSCDGWVKVHPGYAIDSCGNDVVVPCVHDLDVIGAIEACRAARNKKDCYCPPGKDCSDEGEQHWCITLHYQEEEARPQATLHAQAGDCGCSGSGRNTKVPYTCEPTRIRESYRLEVCQEDEQNCFTKRTLGEQQWLDKFTACLTNLRRSLRKLPIEGTLRLGKASFQDAGLNPAGGLESVNLPPVQVHRDTVDLQDFLIELLEKSPGNLHCSLLSRLRRIELDPPGPNDEATGYWQRARLPVRSVLGILLIYLKDCFCHAMLPPCGPCCPGEEPLILACVTVKDGEITDICNYGCRRWAGAFPPSMMGVYLGPIWPLLAKLVGLFCCSDVFENLLGTVKRRSWAQRAAQWVVGSDFANVGVLAGRAMQLWQEAAAEPTPQSVYTRVELASLVGKSGDAALAAARKNGLELELAEASRLGFRQQWAALRSAERGERVVAYVLDGKVAGFAKAGSAEAELVNQSHELAQLRADLSKLEAAVYGRPGGTDVE